MANLNPFSKVLQKQAGRAKERLLQNLGKADRTTDEDFDLHVKNFSKQQNAVLRLQKEFKYYYQCLRAMQVARRSVMDTVCELYEPCWDGVEQFLIKSEVSNKNFEDFCDKLNCELLAPVGSYLCQFPEIANKISKRNRKLLDYDNSRHNLQNLETMKKKEDGKLTKAKEQLEDSRNNFEAINNELHEELPALYDSRVSFFATHLQCLFLTETSFHTQDAAIFVEISDLLEKLNVAYKEGSFSEMSVHFESPKNGADSKLPDPDFFLAREGLIPDSSIHGPPAGSLATQPAFTESSMSFELQSEASNVDEETESLSKGSTESRSIEETKSIEGTKSIDETKNIEETKSIEENKGIEENKNINDKKNSAESKNSMVDPSSAPNVLYQVQGTYKYSAEDVDELSFNVGDVIDVVEYDDPEEQEEGWLMGVFNGKKGLFPANFTSRI